jgi:type II restriction/modification system DNA methylase subunit YeeA
MANKMNLSISKELKQKLEKKTKETGFESIQQYITFVLEQVVLENRENERKEIYNKKEEAVFATAIVNQLQKTDEEEDEDPYSEQEEARLKKHLEDRGYI